MGRSSTTRSTRTTFFPYLILFLVLSHNECMNRAIFAAAMSTAASKTSNKTGALIFLHGLGDSPAGWSSLEQALPSMKPRLAQLEYVFPPAPTIPISINGGMRMPGWFDLYDWPIEVGSKDDPEGLQAGVDAVHAQIHALNAKGIPNDKIVVGGFSQGGAVALLSAYKESKLGGSSQPLAGCVGLSAWLTLPDQLSVPDPVAKKTPLYWGHGTMDDKVVFAQQHFGVEKLREQGVDVTDESFRIGHSSHPEEMESMAKFVDLCIFGDAAEKSEL